MNKLILFLTALLPLTGFSQKEFYNSGAEVYIQTGSLITVQGTFTNDNSNGTNGVIKNDGTIEIQGDFENKANASFGVNTDTTSKERVVKFTGTGTQNIKGTMNTAGTASFYNLVVDKTNASDVVAMQADIAVEGS